MFNIGPRRHHEKVTLLFLFNKYILYLYLYFNILAPVNRPQ